jgi:hypothetical protein
LIFSKRQVVAARRSVEKAGIDLGLLVGRRRRHHRAGAGLEAARGGT